MSTTWTPDSVFEALKHVTLGGTTCVYTPEKCEQIAPLLNRITDLKASRDAILLVHSYVSPEIQLVADFVGDSYELSKKAQAASAQTIVFSAVKFMAETAKLLNPSKQVLVPSKFNGCSLADSITAEQVQLLRAQYPEYTFVCYINTTAAVKAMCDVCVTSSNVTRIIEAIPNSKIYFLPDKLMAQNVAQELAKKGIQKDIKWWAGTCYVHEEFDPDTIAYLRQKHPGLEVVSHPECAPGIIAKSDFVGSTSQMISHVKQTNFQSYFLLTECGLSARLQMEVPDKTFVGSCTMCKYMKSNSLADICRVLEHPDPEDCIEISDETVTKAVACIQAMFEYVEGASVRKDGR